MAFVPQALRKKKRSSVQNKEVKGEKRRCSDADMQQQQQQLIQQQEAIDSESISFSSKSFPPEQIAIPQPSILHDTNTEEPPDTDDPEPYLENEPDHLRLLHEMAKSHPHPYNPHTPNDYLAHRERQKTAALRKDMQTAALAKMEAQERLRQKVREERERIEREGDVNKIVESRLSGVGGEGVGRGRGRGRGVSNLPAWLMKKREEEGVVGAKETGMNSSIGNSDCRISLLNMVGPGEIDSELSSEVREECMRFGTVTNVTVLDANSTNEYVRVDVTFEKKESALEAVKVFDGRMFGERKIAARMYDRR